MTVNTYAFKRLPVTTKYVVKLRCHVVTVSYIAHVPEAKDCLLVKHGVRMVLPCLQYIVQKEKLGDLNVYPFRSIYDIATYSKRGDIARKSEFSEDLVPNLCIYFARPVLADLRSCHLNPMRLFI